MCLLAYHGDTVFKILLLYQKPHHLQQITICMFRVFFCFFSSLLTSNFSMYSSNNIKQVILQTENMIVKKRPIWSRLPITNNNVVQLLVPNIEQNTGEVVHQKEDNQRTKKKEKKDCRWHCVLLPRYIHRTPSCKNAFNKFFCELQ